VLPAQAARLPRRFLATSAAAPAPKSRIMGGAGTGVPPFEPPLLLLPPLDEEELEELDDELLLDDEEPLLLPEVEPVAPELVEVDEVEVPFELEPPKLDELDEVEPPWLELPWLDEPWLEEPWPPDEPEEPFWFSF
jgi:hypothetical protein